MFPGRASGAAGTQERQEEGRLRTRGVVHILEEDPELGTGLSGNRLLAAQRRCRAPIMRIPAGPWREPEWPQQVRGGLGLLVLEGLLLRRVGLGGRFGVELLASGDVLRPWQREDGLASVPQRSGWRVLDASRVAVLDMGFARELGAFPEVHGQIVARTLQRSRHLAVNMAIVQQPKVEVRLHMLFWHLADRCGTVRTDGTFLSIPLTHATLAEMVAASRPTVSTALSAIERSGDVSHMEDGWLLHGAPPGELLALFPAGPD
jgi:CRP-like cAMP-binding protein